MHGVIMKVIIKKASDIGANVISKSDFLDYVCMSIDVTCDIDAVQYVPDATRFDCRRVDLFKSGNIKIEEDAQGGYGVTTLVVNRWGQFGIMSADTKLWNSKL